MTFLKKYFIWLLLTASVGLGVYTYINRFIPCAKPMSYTIGNFDTRFNISKSDFLDAVRQAASVWDKAIGKNLFKYDAGNASGNDLKINLTYDTRQKTTDKNKILTSQVDQSSATISEIDRQIASSKADLASSQVEYAALLAQFKSDQAAYNADVQSWNSKGGAPKDEYQKLEQEKNALISSQKVLEAKRLEVNGLVDEFNALVNKHNTLAKSTNSTIGTINKTAGREFEEGLYTSDSQGQRIDIFEFTDKTVLVRVLAHELGHALGLDHNANPDSIMYYLNNSKNNVPTKEDVSALKGVCKIK